MTGTYNVRADNVRADNVRADSVRADNVRADSEVCWYVNVLSLKHTYVPMHTCMHTRTGDQGRQQAV